MDRKKRSTSISRLREIIDLCNETNVSEITIPGIVSLKIGSSSQSQQEGRYISAEEIEAMIGDPETDESAKKGEMDLLLHSAGA